jgi:hypothetical protein
MRHWFRTQSRIIRHPDGKPGLLQIYLFSNKAIHRPSKRPCRIVIKGCLGEAMQGANVVHTQYRVANVHFEPGNACARVFLMISVPALINEVIGSS